MMTNPLQTRPDSAASFGATLLSRPSLLLSHSANSGGGHVGGGWEGLGWGGVGLGSGGGRGAFASTNGGKHTTGIGVTA